MTKPPWLSKYAVILIAFLTMSAILFNAYFRNIDEEAEYTRTVRHVVVNAYELQLHILTLQYKYNSYVLGHPSISKDDLDVAYGIVSSKYDILLLGDTFKLISKIKGDVNQQLVDNQQIFLELKPYFDGTVVNDKNLVKVNDTLEHELLPPVRAIVKATRIGTNWKSEIWEEATKVSRNMMRLSMIGIIFIFLSLITLLLLQVRATRAALIKAEQAKVAKAKFLTVAGHDLRQPLQASSLLLSTLQSKSQTAENSRLFKGIHHSLDSITELLNGMLDISRLDADLLTVNKEPIPVTPLVNKMLDRYVDKARNKNLKLQLINPEDTYIKSDELLLERIISNLLSNAIRYTQQGKIKIKVSSLKNKVIIAIQDSGSGISKEDQTVIFKEFIQLDNSNSRQKGLGLGLSIVKRLCTLLGHELALTSKLGEGSQFSISLPKTSAPAIGVSHKPRDQWSLSGVTVIVIEDDQDILSSFDLLLSTWGCRVLTASTMEEATALAESLKPLQASKENDLLIVSDYYLNQNYNGCDVIENIKKIVARKVPAMVITAETDPERLEEIRLTGNSVFRKPLKPSTLRVAIQRLLRQP